MIKFKRALCCITTMLLLFSFAGNEFLSACGISGLYKANVSYASSEGLNNEAASDIKTTVVENFTDILVFLGDTPKECPTATKVKLTRTINGVEDEEFEWNGGKSNWHPEYNLFRIFDIPFVPGAEYTVTDKVDELPLDIKYHTQFDYSKITILFSKSPDNYFNCISSVERLINGSDDERLEYFEQHIDEEKKILCINKIGLGDSYSAGSTIQYRFTYKEKVYSTTPFTFDNGVLLSPLKINHMEKKDYLKAEIVFSEVPKGYKPNASSVNIERFIDGEIDTSFEWDGGISQWVENQKKMTVIELEHLSGATYEITDKNDDYKLVIDRISFIETETFELHYNRWSNRPYAKNVNIRREINGEHDFTGYWETSDHFRYTELLFNIERVQPAVTEQEVVYYVGFKNAEPAVTVGYTVPADSAYNELAISLPKDSYTLTVDDVSFLTADITPEDLKNKSVTWSVYQESANNIVTVSPYNGHITAHNPGTATVRATSKGNKAKYADCEITVISQIDRDIAEHKIAIDMAALEIGYAAGDSVGAVRQNLDLTVTGAVYGSSISWSSSNEQVIRIDGNNGYVIRPSYEEGNKGVTLTATITNNSVSGTKSFNLTVLAKSQESTYTPPEPPSTPSSPSIPSVSPTPTPTPTPRVEIEIEASENVVKAKITVEVKKDEDGSDIASVTEDQIKDAVAKSIAEAQGKGDGSAADVEIRVTASGGLNEIRTTIPKAAVQEVTDKGINALTLSTPVADITFDKNAISTISRQATEDVKIAAKKIDIETLDESIRQTIGDRPVFNFNVTSGDKTISEFGGNVEISVPYTPKDGEDTNAIVIYYINAEGKVEVISNCHYDSKTGTVKFKTDHFSKYAVGYNKVIFVDVPENSPYSKAVGFVAARGITLGTGNGKYSPDLKLTRAQLLVMIMRAYGIRSDEDIKDNFADAGDTYYTGYLAAAKRLGISNGVGNNKFAPDLEISKQEMVTLIYNILKLLDELPDDSKQNLEFIDFVVGSESIASWAKEAMLVFMQNEYVNGIEYGLSPAEIANRVQLAQVIYEVLTK